MVLLPAAVGVGLGTAIGSGRAWLALTATFIAILAAGVAVWMRARGLACLLAAVVAVSAASAAASAWRADAETAQVTRRLAADGSFVEVCGSIRGLRSYSLEMTAEDVSHRDRRWETAEPLRLAGPLDGLQPGRRICATGRLEGPRQGRDEPPLLRTRHVEVVGMGSLVVSASSGVREAFSRVARGVLTDEEAGLLLGMTDGDVRLLDEGVVEDFRTTGMAHLVAVSGSNVAVVLAVVMIACRFLVPGRRVLAALLAAPPLVFFAFLTALEPSVLRATVTAGIALAVTASGRAVEGLRAISVAFIVLVLADPDLLFHPGFQLSFAATLGLVVLGPPLSERIAERIRFGSQRLTTAVSLAVGTTVAAQVAVAPLLAWHFGRVPALGGLANLVVAPLAPVVMVGGMATLSLASVSSAFAWAPATMHVLLATILSVARAAAELPAASLALDVAGGLAITAGLAGWIVRSRPVRVVAVAALCASGGVIGGGVIARGSPICGGAGVHVLDVGQGTAVLLRHSGSAVLVDTGPPDGGVVDALAGLGVGSLDALVVSHPDADHVGAAVEVIEAMDVGELVGPAVLAWGVGAEAVEFAEARGLGARTAAAGDRLVFGGIELEVYSPRAGPAPPNPEGLTNDLGLVIEARMPGIDVVLPADIGADVQRRLLRAIPEAGVLVAPHHGSKDIDDRFAGAVGAGLVVVTVGDDNPYGHPAPEALEVYEASSRVMRTDRHGPVSVCASPHGIEVLAAR